MQITNQRGDTIIEVIMAMTIFSLVAVGAMSVMNQGTNSAQRAIETTMVKQQIDAQAEALRAVNQASFVKGGTNNVWNTIEEKATATTFSNSENCETTIPANSFALNPRDATLLTKNIESASSSSAPAYAKIVDNDGAITAYGLWIEGKKVQGTALSDAYDFKISACWYTPGLDVPATLQTIVRLYAS